MDKGLIEEIDKLLKELIEVGIIAQTKDTNKNTNKAIRYLKANGYITSSKTGFKPTEKVYSLSENKVFKSPIEQNINNQNPNKPIKISVLQKVYWIIGILVALTILYEYVVKKLIIE